MAASREIPSACTSAERRAPRTSSVVYSRVRCRWEGFDNRRVVRLPSRTTPTRRAPSRCGSTNIDPRRILFGRAGFRSMAFDPRRAWRVAESARGRVLVGRERWVEARSGSVATVMPQPSCSRAAPRTGDAPVISRGTCPGCCWLGWSGVAVISSSAPERDTRVPLRPDGTLPIRPVHVIDRCNCAGDTVDPVSFCRFSRSSTNASGSVSPA